MLHSLRIYPPFRMLILGTLATNSAFWMYQVAVGWLALNMTDSPFFVGLAGFAGGIPLLLFSLPAGLLIDRYDRRLILLLAQIGVMAVSASFALFVSTDVIREWSMLLLVAIYGTIMTFVFPVRTSMVPSLVSRSDLANAVALNAAGQNSTRVIGPTLAGVFIGTIGVSATFAVAAALQILALLATMKLPSSQPVPRAKSGSGLSGLTVGLRIVAKDPFLLALVIIALAPTVLVMPYLNLMPVFARDELDLGSTGLGVLLASTGLGTVAGALSVARSARFRAWKNAQVITAGGFAVLVLAFSLIPVVWVGAVLLFAAGWLSAAFLAINQTSLHLHVDDDVRGRVMSIYLLTWGALPLGQLGVGALANMLGTPSALALSCILAIICIVAIYRRFLSRPPDAIAVDPVPL